MRKIEGEVTETIESISSKGDGVCFLRGKYECHVSGTCENERVRLRVVGRRRKQFIGKLVELLDRSPQRCSAPCPHAAQCGGCRLQHLNYSDQLILKQKRLEKLFAPHRVQPIIPCDTPWRYRNKMEFTFSQDREGNRFLGLIEWGTKGRVMNLEACHICSEKTLDVLDAVKAWWDASDCPAFAATRGEGQLRTLTIRASRQTLAMQVMLTLSSRLHPADEKNLIEKLKPFSLSLFLNIQHTKKGESTRFELIHLLGEERFEEHFTVNFNGQSKLFRLMASPYSFLQPNTAQAEKIVQKALKLLDLRGDETILDLYSGVGTIGMGLSPFAKEIIAIEIVEQAAQDAKINHEINNVHNMVALDGDVETSLRSIHNQVDVIVVDPPRNGLGLVVIEQILALGPKKLLYISCNPQSQRQDLESLLPNYELIALQPIDQFPHTMHVENIALLIRTTSF
ncbi:MAG: 23S rRNA (uracil(1939)-C(5))-methyltransferase RlmD [Simkaniaceae bacterium]|nr:23S rRNA (uracil(1939)-C(5))-methyltransferase RlmD [Simkaniaceae bacterium]